MSMAYLLSSLSIGFAVSRSFLNSRFACSSLLPIVKIEELFRLSRMRTEIRVFGISCIAGFRLGRHATTIEAQVSMFAHVSFNSEMWTTEH
jgi:hypothetical protein